MNEYQFSEEFAMSIYVNSNGGITICQTDYDGNSNFVVLGSKRRALDLVKVVRTLAHESSFEAEEPETEGKQ